MNLIHDLCRFKTRLHVPKMIQYQKGLNFSLWNVSYYMCLSNLAVDNPGNSKKVNYAYLGQVTQVFNFRAFQHWKNGLSKTHVRSHSNAINDRVVKNKNLNT